MSWVEKVTAGALALGMAASTEACATPPHGEKAASAESAGGEHQGGAHAVKDTHNEYYVEGHGLSKPFSIDDVSSDSMKLPMLAPSETPFQGVRDAAALQGLYSLEAELQNAGSGPLVQQAQDAVAFLRAYSQEMLVFGEEPITLNDVRDIRSYAHGDTAAGLRFDDSIMKRISRIEHHIETIDKLIEIEIAHKRGEDPYISPDFAADVDKLQRALDKGAIKLEREQQAGEGRSF
jgi:hypothetical protein